MKRPYCCDASRDLYEQYYTRQQSGNGEFPVYVGAYSQRGHGLGNLLGSLYRRILPGLKAIGRVAPHALRTAANIIDDVSTGKSFMDSAFERVPQTISKLAFGRADQSGSGVRRKRMRQKKSKKKAKKVRRDIFS
jgi:hypothetical protein